MQYVSHKFNVALDILAHVAKDIVLGLKVFEEPIRMVMPYIIKDIFESKGHSMVYFG